MKKFLLNIWYTILYQFDQHKGDIPQWWYEQKPFDQRPDFSKRVAVAKDVIAQIELAKYRAKKGSYIRYASFKNDSVFDRTSGNVSRVNELDAKSSFDNLENCKVCAIGACILSITRFKNKLKWGELLDHDNFDKSGTRVMLMLSEIFQPYQLGMLEAAFEGSYNCTTSDRVAKRLGIESLSTEDDEACSRFYDLYDSSEERLKTIMQNIIDNNGTFKP